MYALCGVWSMDGFESDDDVVASQEKQGLDLDSIKAGPGRRSELDDRRRVGQHPNPHSSLQKHSQTSLAATKFGSAGSPKPVSQAHTTQAQKPSRDSDATRRRFRALATTATTTAVAKLLPTRSHVHRLVEVLLLSPTTHKGSSVELDCLEAPPSQALSEGSRLTSAIKQQHNSRSFNTTADHTLYFLLAGPPNASSLAFLLTLIGIANFSPPPPPPPAASFATGANPLTGANPGLAPTAGLSSLEEGV